MGYLSEPWGNSSIVAEKETEKGMLWPQQWTSDPCTFWSSCCGHIAPLSKNNGKALEPGILVKPFKLFWEFHKSTCNKLIICNKKVLVLVLVLLSSVRLHGKPLQE